jgi:hypothetical protein
MRFPVLPATLVGLGAVALGSSVAAAQDAHVTVTPTAVRVVVPVEWSAFRWNVPATPDDALEYEWQVAVTNGDRHYEFGFSLFKRAEARPRTGDLADLLRAGQATAWQLTDTGGVALSGWDVSVAARDHAVEIVVRGADAVHALFGALPPRVIIRSLLAVGRRAEQRVPVDYRAP